MSKLKHGRGLMGGLFADAVILIGALVLQQTLARWLAVGNVRPDLTLIALTAVALRRGPLAGLYAGLFLGLLQDVYTVDALGAGVLAKSIVGYAMGFFEEKVMKVMAATRVLLLGLALVGHDLVWFLAAGFRGRHFFEALLLQSLPSAVYTLVLGAVAFYFASGFKPREV
jgi:rod shape-determining protein MreD